MMYTFIDDIQHELDRLGVKQGSPCSFEKFLDVNWHTSEKTIWQKTDPRGEFTDVADFHRYFLGLRWLAVGKLAYRDPVDDEVRRVRMCCTSENYDLVIQGQRRLLYTFTYDESYQGFCSIDLFERNTNPKVYAVPHDECERAYVRYDTVHEFLQTLQKEESLLILNEKDDDHE